MRLLIVGCGYVGSEVARLAVDDCQLLALTRSEERISQLERNRIEPIVGHWLDDDLQLPKVDRVLVSVPHRADRELDTQTHFRGLENLTRCLPVGWSKLVYLSTTGVYGDCENEIVNEQTPVSPTRTGPQIAVAAEQWLLDQFRGSSPASPQITILRLAGIYGPNRIPLASRIRAGEALAVPRDGYLNLVHVHDIARMIITALHRSLSEACYVFSDGQPVLRDEFYRYLADLCGVSSPNFVEADPSESRTRRATSKRVDPSRLVAETEFQYRFPNYRVGLKDALKRS